MYKDVEVLPRGIMISLSWPNYHPLQEKKNVILLTIEELNL